MSGLLEVMDFDGLFGRTAVLSEGRSSLEVVMACLTCYAASLRIVPHYYLPPPCPLTPPWLFTPDLSGRSSVNGRRKEDVSKRSTGQLRPRIWCIACSAFLLTG